MAARTTRTGTCRHTGQLLQGRAHAEQSVRDILTTRKNSIWRWLDYGSDLRALRGENLTVLNLLRAYTEIVTAVHEQEPSIRIAQISPELVDGRNGIVAFILATLFYPYGHHGDYSVVEDFDIRIPARALVRGSVVPA